MEGSRPDLKEAKKPPGPQLTAVERLVCGGLAGAAAKTAIAPADRVKILFQTCASSRFTWAAAWRKARLIAHHTGLRGLWRGHGATLLRVAPYSATAFATFDPYCGLLRRVWPGLGSDHVQFLAGSFAGITATTLTYPLDLMRTRMAAHWGMRSPYLGYLNAMSKIRRGEGVLALYSGLRPTLLGIVPYSGISFGLYEGFKARLAAHQGLQDSTELQTRFRLGSAALAALLAQSTTYPLDIVRRRSQVRPGVYRHEAEALAMIFREEGMKGLYKGFSMNWVKGPIAHAIAFTANDKLREAFLRLWARGDDAAAALSSGRGRAA